MYGNQMTPKFLNYSRINLAVCILKILLIYQIWPLLYQTWLIYLLFSFLSEKLSKFSKLSFGGLNINPNPNPNGVPEILLKSCKYSLFFQICNLFNLSLTSGD